MVNKKDLIIVALATFCLTTTLFMIIPTKSNPSAGEFNNWADINDDGTVDLYDAINLANAFGTSGDATKNVNVTNWQDAYTVERYSDTINVSYVPNGIGRMFPVYVGGFSRFTVLIELVQPDPTDYLTYDINITINAVYWMLDQNRGYLGYDPYPPNTILVWRSSATYPSRYNMTTIFETKAPWVALDFGAYSNKPSGASYIAFNVYLYERNE